MLDTIRNMPIFMSNETLVSDFLFYHLALDHWYQICGSYLSNCVMVVVFGWSAFELCDMVFFYFRLIGWLISMVSCQYTLVRMKRLYLLPWNISSKWASWCNTTNFTIKGEPIDIHIFLFGLWDDHWLCGLMIGNAGAGALYVIFFGHKFLIWPVLQIPIAR